MVRVHFFKASVFMFKKTTVPIWTKQFFCELFAHFGFIFLVLRFLKHKLVFAMCKLTFVSITTKALLNPVLAHLSFKLGLIDLSRLALIPFVTHFCVLL